MMKAQKPSIKNINLNIEKIQSLVLPDHQAVESLQ